MDGVLVLGYVFFINFKFIDVGFGFIEGIVVLVLIFYLDFDDILFWDENSD